MTDSRLIYVMGPSGCGKDSLLGYARERIVNKPVVFAHRYITRPAMAGGENHVALSPREFASRSRAGLFAMDWESHGNRYGIGIEIEGWMAKGMIVIMNGSRGYLDEARRRYPDLLQVFICVDKKILAQRLRARGRENEQEIQARLRRLQETGPPDKDAVLVNNNGSLDLAGKELLRVVEEQCRCLPGCSRENFFRYAGGADRNPGPGQEVGRDGIRQ